MTLPCKNVNGRSLRKVFSGEMSQLLKFLMLKSIKYPELKDFLCINVYSYHQQVAWKR